MKNNKNKKTNIIVGIFDSMFIMILCFATLLSAMLVQNNSVSGLNYIINFKTLIITFLGLVIYLTFMLSQSQKGLKSMINHIYINENNKEVDKR